ncbi:PilW family protein [Clostridium sp. Cult2]|uniref:PilW family protein n=1 Tax=Clostridium sp. Cult2 TaxID=2079003 RepID=UPI001F409988|nr:prepilin-type N-terminal cleavage/methylation domain-containing protein [Clostridium sp. Cult2]MCF6465630.1 hypothetical protein [Clostridium sp. Cult2]
MNKNKGFTLVELILSFAISSIIVLTLFSILNFTIKSCKLGEFEDEVLLNGRYVIEYIKREIKGADKVIALNKFDGLEERYENNLGFVIMKYDSGGTYKYNYSTYFYKNNRIYRDAFNTNIDKLPKGSAFSGNNEIAEYIISIDGSNANFNTKLINLSITLEGKNNKEIRFQSKLNIRCPVIY